jgi:hypothetical protein
MLHYEERSIEVAEWDGAARAVAEPWRMQKDGHVAICSVWTHPDGAELRLTIEGCGRLAEPTCHVWVLSTVAYAWRERLCWQRGWR